MEFAVVNNYMGPVATKAMKGYSDEDLREAIDEFKVYSTTQIFCNIIKEFFQKFFLGGLSL